MCSDTFDLYCYTVKDKRRPSQIEMMKKNLKKVEKTGSDSEDERVRNAVCKVQGSPKEFFNDGANLRHAM